MSQAARRRDDPHNPRCEAGLVMLPIIFFRHARSTSPTVKMSRDVRGAANYPNMFGLPKDVPAWCLKLANYRFKVNVRVISRKKRPISPRLRVEIRGRVVLNVRPKGNAVVSFNGAVIPIGPSYFCL